MHLIIIRPLQFLYDKGDFKMAVIQCTQNHYYDNEKFDECPHCLRLMQGERDAEDSTVSMDNSEEVTQGLQNLIGNYSEEKTVGFYAKKGFSPVAGWLVCAEGNERGRDYKIQIGRNFAGRARNMDIVLSDDPMISREKHFSIAYDPHSISFALIAGQGDTYVNGERVTEPMQLSDGDIIEAGETRLVFVPYCKKERTW